MNALAGWLLCAALLVAGWLAAGWRGGAIAATLAVFWLLLQFNRALRVIRRAAQAPLGHVDSAVMLQSRLQRGMTMPELIALTHSLGRRVSQTPEGWSWEDAGGDRVTVVMAGARVDRWTLERRD